MNTPKLIQENSTIEIKYKLHLMDGTLVDETKNDSFIFTLGNGEMLEKLESLLVGLEVGTTATFIVQPEEAFGEVDANNFHEINLNHFPEEINLKTNMIIGFDGANGEEIPGLIKEIEKDKVIVDFNHPLSGQTIKFETTVISIK